MSNELIVSIRILHILRNQLNDIKSGIVYLSQIKQKLEKEDLDYRLMDIQTTLTCSITYSFILYSSFVEEFKSNFKSNETTEQELIKVIKMRCQPYFDEIKNKFGNVIEPRNKILAHGLRHKDGKVLSDQEIDKYFNQLFDFDELESFTMMSNVANQVMLEINHGFI